MNHNQKIFDTLITEVGEWSARNFGIQASKWPGTPQTPHEATRQSINPPPIILDHTAPLLGIIEECGELIEADRNGNKELIRDSIGDIMIYLADYLYRVGVTASTISWSRLSADKSRTVFIPREVMIVVGRLAHINLKRHQGIRGYNDDFKFSMELIEHLTTLLVLLRLLYCQSHPKPIDQENPLSLPSYTPQEGTDAIITIASNVWQQVKERDWKKHAKTGGT